jgi:glycine/serine hydroxymethyltransferase
MGKRNTIWKNAKVLVAATKENGLEVIAHKTKYMLMSRDQDAGRSHGIKIENSSFESVEKFKILGKNLNK